jgi:hypothetical protein
MKLIASAGVGLALALSVFAFSGTPAGAFQAPAVAEVSQDGIVEVNWRERRYWIRRHEQCRRVRYKCYRRYGWDRHMYRDCVVRRACGR